MPGPNATLRLSDEGLDALCDEEGLARVDPATGLVHRYRDQVGRWTIGYGHLIRDGEDLDAITQAEAREILRLDVRTAEGHVQRLVTVPLSQPSFDALVSFTFNVGGGALARSRLLRLLNLGDREGAAGEFRFWRMGGGQVLPVLVARRRREEARFRSGLV